MSKEPSEIPDRRVQFALVRGFLKGYFQGWRREKFSHMERLPDETPFEHINRLNYLNRPRSTAYLIVQGAMEWLRQMVIIGFWVLTILSICISIFFGKELALFNWPLLYHDFFTRLIPYEFHQLFTRGTT